MKELAFVVFNGEHHTDVISIVVRNNTETLVADVLRNMPGYVDLDANFAAAGLCQNPFGALKNPGQVTEYTAGDHYIRAVVCEREDIPSYREQLSTRG